jgi:hypothetical protein
MAILNDPFAREEGGIPPDFSVDLNIDLEASGEEDARVWAERAVNAEEEKKAAVSALGDLASAVLRLVNVLEPLSAIELPEVRSILGKVSYVAELLPKTLHKAGIHVVDLAGLPYSAGLDVDVLNLADFEPTDHLAIDVVVEPLLVYTPRLAGYSEESQVMTIRPGRVTVKKAEGF